MQAMEQAATSQHGGEPDPLDTTGLCLLSLDGGGVRGLSTLYILKRIMARLNNERIISANLPPVKPCEVFDLIGGTSTGGLIAIMLGRLELDVDQCILAYNELAEAVFGKKSSRLPFNIKGKVKAQFDSAKLEKAIRKTIKDSGKSEAELFNDGVERGCRTFVCTVDQNTKNIIRLRSYTSPDESNIPATLCEAALATSAATTFFKPVSIGNRTFSDGGLGANNPVDEVEGEAANIWCSESGDLKPLVKCFLSIGTGNPGIEAFDDKIINFLSRTVVGIATETEKTEKIFIARWRKHFDENRYFRFNVDQGLQAIGLEEYKKDGEIQSATDLYLDHQAQKNRVRDCLQNLRLKQNKTITSFADVLNEFRIFKIRQNTVVRETYWMVPFERNLRFTGRKNELARLEGMLFIEHRTTKIAITGLGGVGKTSLLIELVHRTREKRKKCSIIWIPAISMESLDQAYQDVARQLSIAGCEDEKADVKKLVQNHLSKETFGEWLLVFDNADDIEMWIGSPGLEQKSDHLIDYLPKSDQGCIVFTTRDMKASYKLVQRKENVIKVPDMAEDVAMQLLQKYLPDQDLVKHELEAKDLLGQLTYLPLAIVQAASYINENTETIAAYLSLLREREEKVIDLLSEEFEDESRYRDIKNPVATTFLISFEHIRQQDFLAFEYLSFVACISPKDVPQSLLPPSLSRKRETDAIGTLNAYSFITRRSDGIAFDVHRLVHLATRSWLRKERSLLQWTENAITRLADVFPSPDHKNRSVWRGYLPHARCVLDSTLIEISEEKRINLAWKVGMCLYEDGRWKEAEGLLVQVVDIHKKFLGLENPDTLTSMTDFALLLTRLGKFDESELINRQTLWFMEKVYSLDHPKILTNMSNLALVLERRGKYNEAELIIWQALQLREKTLGLKHPDTLISMNNLAMVLGLQRKFNEAEPINRQTLQLRGKVLGLEHPDTLTSMNNLAWVFVEQGKYNEAEPINRQTLQLRRKVLGLEHPDTLFSMNNLAVNLYYQGKYNEAESIYQQTFQLQKEILGSEHPDTLWSRYNFIRLLKDQGRYEEAEAI